MDTTIMSEGSLPTPPGTSHRKEKENRVPEFSEPGPSTPRVVWAEKNEYRLFENSTTTDFAVPASSLKRRPSKSILKATTSFNLAIPFVEEEEREVTPEPSDPLVDLNYLDGPVSRILAPNASLRDLIEAYSILAARIRSSVSDSTDGDASWPLFQPLRKNREAFVSALERDLGRALEDPVERPIINDTSDVEMIREVPMLPSPKDSPRKKRGMSAEQVKYARDLCTTCHSVIKLLGIIFTLPAVCSLFSNAELRSILTALLAIPLAPQLPTPNARKTNALAIWLLQTQRLPEEVLAPAASRIAYAIRRGLDGELGKEGKKGSVSDGLRAVHELSTLYPSTFVPAFTHLLPSIFPHLVGGGMVLRSQACHALGGLALGSAYLPSSPCHEDLADHVVNFLAPVPISSPVKGKGIASPSQLSPSKRANPREDAYIIRTLRATLKQSEPKSPAHGPVWALCVMSHLVVLLRTRVFMVEELRNIFSALFTLALNQTKSSVKGLACVAWRCVFWAWCQNIPVPLLESESEDDSELALVDEKFYEKELSRMLNLFTAATTVLDLGSGSSMVCSLLNTNPVPTHVEGGIVAVHLAFGLLKNMLRKGGNAYSEAVDVLAQLASDTSPVDNTEWNIAKTLPQALFEPNTELLLVDFKSLPTVVRPILARLVDQEDSRNFTTEELLDDDVMQYYFFLLRECVVNHKTYAVDQQLPSEIRDIWHTYLKRKYDYLKEHGTQEQRKAFAKRVAAEIFSLFIDKDRIVFKMDDPDADLLLSPSAPKKRYRMPAPPHLQRLLKLKLTQELWVIVSEVFSKEQCKTWALPLLTWFIQNEEDVVGHLDAVDETRECWASFCARFCLARDPSEMDIFWDGKPLQTKKERTWEWSPQVKGITWMEFIKRWQFGENQWEMGVMLLSVPFRSSCAWEMSTSQLREWEETLDLTINQALDCGVDVATVLNRIASRMHADVSSPASIVRAADILLTRLDDTCQLPTELLDLVNDVLLRTYPPSPREVVKSIWLLRTLTNLISSCEDSAETLFRNIWQGVSVWIADECKAVEEDYVPELGILYQTILVSAQTLQTSPPMLDILTPILHSAFIGPKANLPDTIIAFAEFWQATYAEMDEPEKGWSKEIKVCLRAIDKPGDDDSELESSEVEEHLTAVDDRARSISPEIELLQPAFEVHVQEDSALERSPYLFTTPAKRRKSPAAVEFPSMLAPSMSPSSSPKRLPVTPKKTPRSELRMLRDLSDKENRSPLPVITSVMDRIMSSPQGPSFVTPSKKRSRTDPEDAHRVIKRQKRTYGSSPALATIPEVPFGTSSNLPLSALTPPAKEAPQLNGPVTGLTPIPAFSFFGTAVSNRAMTTPTKKSTGIKRKGEYMDAVEVFTYRAVRRRTASLPEPKIGPPMRKSTQLRRTRSMTKVNSEEVQVSRKRKRLSLDSSRDESDSPSPLKHSRYQLDDMIGSDDSLMLATPSKYFVAPQHSDDDAWIGQVTPHRLISPSIRRLRDEYDFSDPPSDDSIASVSPTSERQARRSGGSAILSSAAKARLEMYNTPRQPFASLPIVEDL